MLLASKSSNLGVQPEMRIWGPTALFPITPHKRVRVLKNGPISSRRRYRSWYVPVASTGRQPPHSEMSATRWDGVDRPHYATSSSCSPWTFVRARSVACAQVPQNTTVTQPCVLLPVGSWLLPICWPVAASRSRSFAGATPPEQPCRTSLAHRGSISSSELLSRRAGCRISLCPPGRRKTGTEIAPRESERVAGPILAIRIYPR